MSGISYVRLIILIFKKKLVLNFQIFKPIITFG